MQAPATEESRAFWYLRRRLAANVLRQTLRESRLRLTLVLALSALFWAALFWLFATGFAFLGDHLITHAPTRVRAVGAIFNVFFLSLLVMLLFSAGIIVYGGLFRSRETEFLLMLPTHAQQVFVHKFQEAVVFSSWGFILLGSPMLVAYGLAESAPWYYFVMMLPLMIAFVQIPCALGAAACLAIVRWMPDRKVFVLAVLILGLLLLVVLLASSLLTHPKGAVMSADWFNDLLGRLQFSEQRLLPGWWLTSGLLEAADRQLSESVLYLTLLVANALFFHQVGVWTAARLFWPAFHGSRAVRTQTLGLRLNVDRLVAAATLFLPRTIRLLIVNDLRLFRRDPVQWTQFLIFFGLLGFYFANIRKLSYDLSHATWVNMVSFLNLTVVGLILSTFTSRFVFPMISLEGRRLWLLARLPIRRGTILWSKFLFAALGSMIPCLALVALSDLMLRVMPAIFLLHLVICAMLCLGLAALAVGMGAKMPNLREDSPSKIAAGFGGTLNLVVSTIYIAAIVLLTALPCHFYLGALEADPNELVFDQTLLRVWIAGGALASLVLCGLATIVPLRMGIRAFERLEL
jgi:ABC-2 type transport system permease protein